MNFDEESLRAMLPMGFGGGPAKKAPIPKARSVEVEGEKVAVKTSWQVKSNEKQSGTTTTTSTEKKDDKGKDAEDAFAGPPRPTTGDQADTDSDEEELDDEAILRPGGKKPTVYVEGYAPIPLSHEIVLAEHAKAIQCLALDPSGSRLLTGSADYDVKFWDFAGMDVNLRPFRSITPWDGYPVRSLQYTLTGDRFLVATGSAQAKIYNRDGFQIAEFIKGDMYLADMIHTRGHVSALSKAMWSPVERDVFCSSAADGTVRIWNANEEKKQLKVIKVKPLRGMRVPVSTCTYTPDGKSVVAATQDGQLQIWSTVSNSTRPNSEVRDAHEKETITSSLCVSNDGKTLLSRGGDHTLKVWDLRSFRKPVHVIDNLLNNYHQTETIFSPDNNLILTAVSAPKTKKDKGDSETSQPASKGLVVFYERSTMNKVCQIGVSQGSAVSLLWHPKINQIIVGSTDSSAHVYYDPNISTNGALLSVSRGPRKRDESDEIVDRPIMNPHALPMFKAEPTGKRKRERDRKDYWKTNRPDVGTSGPGSKGRVGSSLTQHLMKHLTKKNDRAEDPREALLKYAKVADETPFFFSAYKETQPVPIFDTTPEDEEEQQEEKK